LISGAVVWVVLAGCATARLVESESEIGGIVTVNPPQSPEARDKAKAMMQSTCGAKPFRIVKEGETVVGQTTQGTQEEKPIKTTNLFGKKSPAVQTTSNQTTTNVTEWRLTFKCGSDSKGKKRRRNR
jgi:hypothetical protein